jgi:tetratricopeptide (TPR) repeat protein
MDSSYDSALVNLGLARELEGNVEEARGIYMKILGKTPSSVQARNNLAALEYDKGAGTMDVLRELDKALMLSSHQVIRDNVKALKSR